MWRCRADGKIVPCPQLAPLISSDAREGIGGAASQHHRYSEASSHRAEPLLSCPKPKSTTGEPQIGPSQQRDLGRRIRSEIREAPSGPQALLRRRAWPGHSDGQPEPSRWRRRPIRGSLRSIPKLPVPSFRCRLDAALYSYMIECANEVQAPSLPTPRPQGARGDGVLPLFRRQGVLPLSRVQGEGARG